MFLSSCPGFNPVRFSTFFDGGDGPRSAWLNTSTLPAWQFVRYRVHLGDHLLKITEKTSGLERRVWANITMERPVLNVQLQCDPNPTLRAFVHESGWVGPAVPGQVEFLDE